MEEEKKNEISAIDASSKEKLRKESQALLTKIIDETDTTKAQDLTVLFNINQNKKTMARVDKLNDLLDVITDQAIERFTTKPDNISNQELIQSLKVVQDMVERGQKQVSGQDLTPLIQINQQTNEVNVNQLEGTNRASREKVKDAVLSVLKGLGVDQAVMSASKDDVVEVIDAPEEAE